MKTGFSQKLTWIFLFMVFALVGRAVSAEYRNFKNQAGKTVHARIVEYDADGAKVQLELKNRKKAWVEVATLSEEDQEYITQWYQEKSKEAFKMKKLSEKEVRAITKQYVKAIKESDYELWKQLVSNSSTRKDGITEQYFRMKAENRGSLKREAIDGHNVKISGVQGGRGWLLLQPDGKVKYDPVILFHPLRKAGQYLGELFKEKETTVARGFDVLRSLGIPCFDFDPTASAEERSNEALKIFDWYVRTNGDWDNSEPMLGLPLEEFEGWVRFTEKAIKTYADVPIEAKEHEEYLQKWKRGSATVGGKGKLERQEVHDIAKLYIKAVAEGNTALWRNLFSDIYRGDNRLSSSLDNLRILGVGKNGDLSHIYVSENNISIAGIDGYNVEINIEPRFGQTESGWLQLLPDGKIKYDPLVFRHPFVEIEEALYYMVKMEQHDTTIVSQSLGSFGKYNVPKFGYDRKAEKQERKESRKKIADWLLEKNEDWDVTEPKLTLPKDRYKKMVQRVRNYR